MRDSRFAMVLAIGGRRPNRGYAKFASDRDPGQFYELYS